MIKHSSFMDTWNPKPAVPTSTKTELVACLTWDPMPKHSGFQRSAIAKEKAEHARGIADRSWDSTLEAAVAVKVFCLCEGYNIRPLVFYLWPYGPLRR